MRSGELWHLGDVALGTLDHCYPYDRRRTERLSEVYRDRCQLTDLLLTNTSLTLSNRSRVPRP